MAIPVAAIVAGIQTAGAVAESISKMSTALPKPPQDLTHKDRWLTVTVFNQTQYQLVYQNSYFYSGGFWTAPTNVPPFEKMTFSGCDADNSFMTGVSGGVQFSIAVPGKPQKFGVGFSSPQFGSYRASAIAGATPEAAYEAMETNTITTTTPPLLGTDTDGKPATVTFLLVSAPGAEASVTVTQQVSGG